MEEEIRPGYTRVTEVFDRYVDFSMIPPDILKNAAERGTMVHRICEDYTNGIEHLFIEPDKEGYVESFKKFWVGKEKISNPGRLYCDELMITGEVDGVYLDRETGEFVLYDLKTPVNESRTWALQGAAYAYLLGKSGMKVDRIEFIKLNNKGKIPKKYGYTYKENFYLFKACLDLKRYFEKKKIPRSDAAET